MKNLVSKVTILKGETGSRPAENKFPHYLNDLSWRREGREAAWGRGVTNAHVNAPPKVILKVLQCFSCPFHCFLSKNGGITMQLRSRGATKVLRYAVIVMAPVQLLELSRCRLYSAPVAQTL